MSGEGRSLDPLTELPARVPDQARIYLRPVAIEGGETGHRLLARADLAVAIAGGRLAATAIEVLIRDTDRITSCSAGVRDLRTWGAHLGGAHGPRVAGLLGAMTGARSDEPPRPGPLIMGVVNVTPDSFSDGGDFASPEAVIDRGRAMIAEGADILDIGGESTRPGSEPVAPAEEMRRVLPVVEALAGAGVPISVDTRNAETMRQAIAAGARVVNDVSALRHDSGATAVVARSGVAVVLMHALGDPLTMQKDPRYDFAPLDVFDMLEARVEHCVANGIGRDRIVVDPGIGFGKTLWHNLQILHRIALLHGLGCPILLGVSRKSFIGRLSKGEPPKERGPGSLAAALAGVAQGVGLLRVHDVAGTAQALALTAAIAAPERYR